MIVQHIDGMPSAEAGKGMIRLALRSRSIEGVSNVVSEFALTPHAATHVILALTNALAQHNGADACNVVAFAPLPHRPKKPHRPRR